MKAALLFALLLLPGRQAAGDLREAVRFYEKGDFRQAVSLLQQLKKSQPANPEIRLWLGKSLLKIRKWDDAIPEMEKAVQMQPDSARYHLWLGRAAGVRASHSMFITAMSWAKRVVKEFETAREYSPDDLDVRFDLLDFYLNAPGILGGGKEKAEAEALAISKLAPAKGYLARAIIFQKNKKWDLAKKQLIQATLEYPKDADAWNDLADYLLQQHEFENALDCANKSLALGRHSKKARMLAAAAKTRLKRDLDQAAKSLEELAVGTLPDDDPAFEDVYYWLGECYLAKGNRAEATAAYQSALSFDQDYAPAKESLSRMK